MFLIMGISSGEKKLQFDQLEICRFCGRYGHVEDLQLLMISNIALSVETAFRNTGNILNNRLKI